ncbi:hypothetical protein AGMMS49960_18120 [Betaproteobacteria bacterium]|nr:hypothetical protein AGMMS49960_18120 [Betaproteobacteria bacterium]
MILACHENRVAVKLVINVHCSETGLPCNSATQLLHVTECVSFINRANYVDEIITSRVFVDDSIRQGFKLFIRHLTTHESFHN